MTLPPSPESSDGSELRSWVLIETGSNQDFILSTNRRAYAVGASHVLKQVAVWVDNAVKEQHRKHQQIDSILVTSSKAMLLVADPEVGKELVEAVTRSAVAEAPGLDIWGYVEPALSVASNPMTRLGALFSAHAEQRWRRAHPVLRAPLAPFLTGCAYTGRAAVGFGKRGDESVAVSAQASSILSRTDAAREAMEKLLPDHVDAIASTKDGDELVNAGWVAVIHADGNGIANVISAIKDLETLRLFSEALEQATTAALRAAVEKVSGPHPEQQDDSNIEVTSAQETSAKSAVPGAWLLPLVVGGDDITVACDARHAVQFTRTYLNQFERFTAESDVIKQVADEALGTGYLTASAGIAVVKPKYPYASAYELAEMLTAAAKKAIKATVNLASHRSSYDLHILRDSVMRALPEMRLGTTRHSTDDISLDSGPWLAPSYAPCDSEREWVTAHEDQPLVDQVQAVLKRDDRPLSSSEIRRLREALQAGGNALEAVGDRLAARSINGGENPFLLDNLQGPTLTRWPAVLDMIDIATGTVARRDS